MMGGSKHRKSSALRVESGVLSATGRVKPSFLSRSNFFMLYSSERII